MNTFTGNPIRIVVSALAATAFAGSLCAQEPLNTPCFPQVMQELAAGDVVRAGSPVGYLIETAISTYLSPAVTSARPISWSAAQSLFRLGRQEARAAVERFAAQAPNDPAHSSALLLKARYALNQKAYPKAITLLEAVHEGALTSEDLTQWQVLLAYALEQNSVGGERTEQLFRLAAAQSNTWGDIAKLYLASVVLSEGDSAQAENLYRELTAHPDLAREALVGLASVNYYNGRFTQAADLLQQSQSYPTPLRDDALFLHVAGNTYYRLEQPEAAVRYLERLRAYDPHALSAQDYLTLGAAYAQTNRLEEAIAPLLQATSSEDETAAGANLYLGRVRRDLGYYNDALASFEAATAPSAPREVRAAAMYEMALLMRSRGGGNLGSEIRITEEFLNEFPQSKYAPAMTQFLGEFYYTNRDFALSAESINRIKNPAPSLLVAKKYVLNGFAAELINQGALRSALQQINQALALKVSDAVFDGESLLLRSRIYRLQGDYAQSEADLTQFFSQYASAATPYNRAQARYYLGYARFARKKYSSALQDFSLAARASELSPDLRADAWSRQGDCLYSAEQYSAAQEAYRQAYSVYPQGSVYALFMQADIEGFLKQYKAQTATLERLIATHPRSSYAPAAYYYLGRGYEFMGEDAKARNAYSTLADRFPGNEYARSAILQSALSYYNSGQTEQAIRSYTRVIRSAPQSDEAQVAFDALKTIYVEQGREDELLSLSHSLGGVFTLQTAQVAQLAFARAEEAYQKNSPKAADLLREVAQKYPGTKEALQARLYEADLYYRAEQTDRALALYKEVYPQRASLTASQRKTLYFRLDALAHNSKDAALALEGLKELLKMPLDPQEEALAYRRAGERAYTAESFKQSKEWAQLGIQAAVKDQSAGLYLLLGKSCQALGQTAAAIEAYKHLESAISTAEGSEAAVRRARLYLKKKETLPQAKTLMDKLLDQGSDSPEQLALGIITLADYYLQTGNKQTARQYLQSLQKNYGDEASEEIRREIELRLAKTK